VGINLLREGLDLPEVSLVAILDADKEGFLRSTRSLIQTFGRAARHIHGRVIMYADVITSSMQQAMEETNRRRQIQTQFNAKHGITPRSVQRAVQDVLDSDYQYASDKIMQNAKIAEQAAEYLTLTPAKLAKKIKQLEQKMLMHAKNLEFEQAAALRDQIKKLKEIVLIEGQQLPH